MQDLLRGCNIVNYFRKILIFRPNSHAFFFSYRNAGINELQNLKYLPRSSIEREITFEDRTPAHADHVGMGLDRQTTAAVGKFLSQF